LKATIYHNPLCGTSRKTLQILEESGADLNVVEYLKTPPTAAELARLYARAGLAPREGLRMKEAEAQALVARGAGDGEILEAMVRNPVLIERPLVETEKGALLCRPQDRVREIL
jgi:arsenate reductase